MTTTILISQIMECVIFPLLSILTLYVIKLISVKINNISKTRENVLEKKYLEMLDTTISNCVTATTQTYVDSLKKSGKFDIEAQKEAFNQTYSAVMNILSDEAKIYLSNMTNDLNLYITQKIEAEVKLSK